MVAFAVATGAGGLATEELVAFVALVPLWVVGAKLFGLYGADEQRIDHSTVDEIVAVVLLDTVASWALVAAAYLAGRLDTLAGDVVLFWLVALAAVVTVRSGTRALVRRRPSFRQRALILGADETGRLVERKLRQHPEYGVDVVGFADDRANPEIETIGVATELPELVRTLGVERVIVTFGAAVAGGDARRDPLARRARRLRRPRPAPVRDRRPERAHPLDRGAAADRPAAGRACRARSGSSSGRSTSRARSSGSCSRCRSSSSCRS